jgi:hypothetical protein
MPVSTLAIWPPVILGWGHLDKAKEAYEQALAIQKTLAFGHPEVVEYRRAAATSQDGLGFVDYRAGRFAPLRSRQDFQKLAEQVAQKTKK